MNAANDNRQQIIASVDFAVEGQTLTIRQAHRKFGQSYAQFVGHAGDGKHIIVRKLISSMWKSRWTKRMKVARADVIKVHTHIEEAC
jgi:hypothetical protein